LLIRRLRQQPFCVLLLDEIEKAGPEVFDVLLSVCDEGRLTARFGRMTTFRGCVIVMTSNLGSERYEAFGIGSRGRRLVSMPPATFSGRNSSIASTQS
jgi:ATP-dependent Clp protease ATP-binding subunit ClpC